MKRIIAISALAFACISKSNSQVVLNELYTDPGAGNSEFFELYSTSPTSEATDNFTLVTFFEISGVKGFYVMDLPNLNIASRSFFVGSAAIPFNYQSITNSSASDFNWNSSAFTSNNGYLKKWVQGTTNALDGNTYYDLATIPANFNDFFYRRTGTGASYTIFLYNNGVLINTFIGGTGGNATIINDIVNMPSLYIDMSGSSPDFTINFSTFGSIPLEYCTNDAGSDNGYIREFDGACGYWKKSSSSVQHTPKATNGTFAGATYGSVSVSVAISQGFPAVGSLLHNDIVGAPSSYFPIDLQIYTDLGSSLGYLDAGDVFVHTNTETVVSDGPFYTIFTPWDANLLIAVKTSVGCFDKIISIPNAVVLAVKLMNFTGERTTGGDKFTWEVENNETVDRFELQKSEDGIHFSSVGLIFPTENAGRQTYPFTHAGGTVDLSYRLLILSNSGKVEYSNTISFKNGKNDKANLQLLSNPAREKLSIRYQSEKAGAVNIRIIDMAGHVIFMDKKYFPAGAKYFDIPLTGKNRGAYLLDLEEGGIHFTKKFIVQ
jgi:hypothetical protein